MLNKNFPRQIFLSAVSRPNQNIEDGGKLENQYKSLGAMMRPIFNMAEQSENDRQTDSYDTKCVLASLITCDSCHGYLINDMKNKGFTVIDIELVTTTSLLMKRPFWLP